MASSTAAGTSTVNFQTVRLKRGKHSAPEHGVCVMELTSMLGGERFSDHPRSVSPVIAAFLRVYNDSVDESRRQELYRYAAEATGTRGSRRLERERARVCDAWLSSRKVLRRTALSSALSPSPTRRRRVRAAVAAQWAAGSPTRHAQALALVDVLIKLGGERVQPEATRDHSVLTASAS